MGLDWVWFGLFSMWCRTENSGMGFLANDERANLAHSHNISVIFTTRFQIPDVHLPMFMCVQETLSEPNFVALVVLRCLKLLMVSSHYSNQCWHIVNWTLGNKLQWNLNRNLYIFVQENAFEIVVRTFVAILSWSKCVNDIKYEYEFCKMAAILFRLQCDNVQF